MLRFYQSLLHRRPVATQVATTSILFGAGDVLAQQLVDKKGIQNHDALRTGRMALYGLAVFGPAATLWYRGLQKIKLSTKGRTVVARVAADQAIFTPINMLVFLSSMSFMEGYGPNKITKPAGERIRERLQSTYVNAVKANFMIWPWVQLVNFSMVPLNHQVLVVNSVALGWNCYLSYLNSQGGEGEKTHQVKEEVVSNAEKEVVKT